MKSLQCCWLLPSRWTYDAVLNSFSKSQLANMFAMTMLGSWNHTWYGCFCQSRASALVGQQSENTSKVHFLCTSHWWHYKGLDDCRTVCHCCASEDWAPISPWAHQCLFGTSQLCKRGNWWDGIGLHHWMGTTHLEWLQEVEVCCLEVKADHFHHIFDLDRSLMSVRYPFWTIFNLLKS